MVRSPPPLPVIAFSAILLSMALTTAFSAGTTDTRTVTASIVTDANSYLGLSANSGSPHAGFVTVAADGTISLTFDTSDNSGTGLNIDASHTFDAVIQITNQGSNTTSMDASVAGADAADCTLALKTTSTGWSDVDYSANPSPVELSVGAPAYLGIGMDANGYTATDTIDCTITVTAGRVV